MARRHVVAARPRQMIWAGIDLPGATIFNVGQILAVANASLLALRPFTIVRIRGVFLVTSDQGAASETNIGAFGAIVVQEEAVDAGVASVPTPIDEPSAPWFVYEPFVHELAVESAVGFNSPVGTYTRWDSKAMRKVGLTEDVIFVGENTTSAGGIITGFGRMLIKLH